MNKHSRSSSGELISDPLINFLVRAGLSFILLMTLLAALTRACSFFPFSLLAQALELLNFGFHEMGHLFVGFFTAGFFSILAGTLGQLFVPFIFMAAALRQGKQLAFWPFLLWFGINFKGISIYMADAQTQALPLLSPLPPDPAQPLVNDWTRMLTTLHLLPAAVPLSWLVYLTGLIIMGMAVVGPLIPVRFWSKLMGKTLPELPPQRGHSG